MSNFRKDIIDPLKTLKRYFPEANISHISYNPKMKRKDRQYWRIDQTTHDGTLVFSIDALINLLKPLLLRNSYYIGEDPIDWERVKDIHYEVGPISIATVFGIVNLPAGDYPGQKERLRMPVKSRIIYE